MIQEPTWPATELVAVTKSDSTELTDAARLIYTGTGGDIAVQTTGGTTVTFKNVPAGGTIGPFFVKKVMATNTSASELIAFV